MRSPIVLIALAQVLACGMFATPSSAQTDENACVQTCLTTSHACIQDDPSRTADCNFRSLGCEKDCRINSLQDRIRQLIAENNQLTQRLLTTAGSCEGQIRQLMAEREQLKQVQQQLTQRLQQQPPPLPSDMQRALDMQRLKEQEHQLFERRKAEIELALKQHDPTLQYRCGQPGAELRENNTCVYDPTTEQDIPSMSRATFRMIDGKYADSKGRPFPNRTSCNPARHEVTAQQNPLRCAYPAIVFKVDCMGRAALQTNGTCVYDPTTEQDIPSGVSRVINGKAVDGNGKPFPNRTSCHPYEQTVQQNPLRCAYEAPGRPILDSRGGT
jgi:hypothetical protein